VRALVVRHARAGDRTRWTGDDRLRPLDGKGRRQAAALVDALASREPTRILSSPYLRCVETVELLAERLALPLETSDELAEGSLRRSLAELVRNLGGTPLLCVHGDLMRAVSPDPHRVAKGATWILDVGEDRIVAVEYVPPLA
jgi:phosphohistidine phosphatase SixA